MLALIETAALGSCGDYLEPHGMPRESVAEPVMTGSGLADDLRDLSGRGELPVTPPSRCSSGRCEGIPPLSSPIPASRMENREPIHFFADVADSRLGHRLSGRWSRPADEQLPQVHKGSIDPPPPRG